MPEAPNEPLNTNNLETPQSRFLKRRLSELLRITNEDPEAAGNILVPPLFKLSQIGIQPKEVVRTWVDEEGHSNHAISASNINGVYVESSVNLDDGTSGLLIKVVGAKRIEKFEQGK